MEQLNGIIYSSSDLSSTHVRTFCAIFIFLYLCPKTQNSNITVRYRAFFTWILFSTHSSKLRVALRELGSKSKVYTRFHRQTVRVGVNNSISTICRFAVHAMEVNTSFCLTRKLFRGERATGELCYIGRAFCLQSDFSTFTCHAVVCQHSDKNGLSMLS